MIIAILIISILGYLFCCFYFINLILQSTIFSSKQKKINISLVIILPIIWCPLMYTIIKTKTGGSHDKENKKKRDSNRGWIIQEVGEG